MRLRRLAVLVACALALLCVAGTALAAPRDAGSGAASTRAKKRCALKRKAKCRKAVIKGKKVGKVNLAGANLRGATISKTTFSGTNLTRASFRGATLRNVTFRRVRLTAATFRGAHLHGVHFDHVALAAPRSTRCSVQGSYTLGCDRVGASFAGASIADASFMYSNLSNASFAGATLTDVDFRSVSLQRAEFSDSTWIGRTHLYSDGATPTVGGVTFSPNARYATFDGSSGATVYPGVDIRFASFAGATGLDIRAAGSDIRGIRGRGAAVASFGLTAVDRAAADASLGTVVTEPSTVDATVLFGVRTCDFAAPCSFRPYVRGAGLAIHVAGSEPESLLGTGIDCAGPVAKGSRWVADCTGEAAEGGSAVLFRTAASHLVSIQRFSLAAGVHTIVVIDVARSGADAVVASTTCDSADDATCAVRVPTGMRVRVSTRVVGGTGLVLVRCPAETLGDPTLGSGAPNSHYACPYAAVDADLVGSSTVST